MSLSLYPGDPQARWIDPSGTARGVLLEKLEEKNRQLAVAEHERLLLVVNWAIIVDEPDIVRALSSITFEQYDNIDKIFFEARPNQFSQVYDRTTYFAILNKDPTTDADPTLLLRYLKHQLSDKKRQAYDFVRSATEQSGSIQWLDDNTAKENLVRYAQDMTQTDQLDDALWVIRQLKNDPDPDPTGGNSADDPEGRYNYHRRILNGEEEVSITTVRGHLCWLIAKVIAANKPEYYGELISILDRYLSEPNLYIRTQAIIPLTELTVRIRAIRNEDGSLFDWDQESRAHVKALAFRTLTENASHPRVLQQLLHVFSRMRGMSEVEARTVLTTFLQTGTDDILHELAPLILYFGLFRKHQFPEEPPFKPDAFIELIKDQIRFGEPSMRRSLAWHFWDSMHQNALSLEEARPYLLMFWTREYDQGLASTFDLMWEDLLQKSPLDACQLFEAMIERLYEFTAKHPELVREVWITKAGDVAHHLATYPSRLLKRRCVRLS